MPLAGRVMVADLTTQEAEAVLEEALASQLREPDIEVRPTGYGARQVFIGGEVGQPGVYELPGDIGALEAVLMAGGFKDTAKRRAVVVVRRTLDGGAMMRVADLQSGLDDPVLNDRMPLKRFDVVFVPRSTIAEVNVFMRQYVRDALPVNFGLYYDLRDR
jgi:polysaccharide export outer membrane protein